MAGAKTGRGAEADAAAESNDATAAVEVSEATVDVVPSEEEGGFKPVELEHFNTGEKRTATSLAEKYALEFRGYRVPRKS